MSVKSSNSKDKISPESKERLDQVKSRPGGNKYDGIALSDKVQFCPARSNPTNVEHTLEHREKYINAGITFTRDRIGKIIEGNNEKDDSSAIDICVGYASSTPQSSLPKPKAGEKAEPGRKDLVLDPHFIQDACRIYISQKCDVDHAFGIEDYSVIGPREMPEFERRGPLSAIAIKADDVRVISRRDTKIVAGVDYYLSKEGVPNRGFGQIHLIGGGNPRDQHPEPLVKGYQLVKLQNKIIDNIDAFAGAMASAWLEQMRVNKALADHVHLTSFGPSLTEDFPNNHWYQCLRTNLAHNSNTVQSMANAKRKLTGVKENKEEYGVDSILSPFNKTN